MVPAPLTVAPLLLVRLPPATVPPTAIRIVPELAQAGLTVNVLAATLIVPLLAGATVSVALLFRLKLPLFAKLLLIAPWKNIAPVLVTGPLKYVVAVTLIVAALLMPPLTIPPATEFASDPVPAITQLAGRQLIPRRSSAPPLIVADPVIVLPPLRTVKLPAVCRKSLLIVPPKFMRF